MFGLLVYTFTNVVPSINGADVSHIIIPQAINNFICKFSSSEVDYVKTIKLLSSIYLIITCSIGVLKNNSENTISLMSNIIKADYIEYETTNEMIDDLYNGKIQSIILSNNETETLKLKSNKILKETRSIYEIKIKNEI